MFYFSSDPHGHFDYIIEYASTHHFTKTDTLIILGDAGFYRFFDERDEKARKQAASLPCPVLTIRGNHDARVEKLPGFHPYEICGCRAYVNDAYPSLFFLDDGQFIDCNGLRCFLIGGALTFQPEEHIRDGIPVYNHEQ